jgi:hypothetical protein
MTRRSPSDGSDHESAASAALLPSPEIRFEQIGDELVAYWADDLAAFPRDGRMEPA